MSIYIGLIGGGNISDTHARAARAIPGVEIAAIYGTNAAKVAGLCQQYGGQAYQDFDAFLKHHDLDVVIIGSPSGLHAEHGIAAARRGLHVLTEKPMDISTERADALIEAAEQSGVKLGIIFQDRLKPEIRQVREWIGGGDLGQILLIDARVPWYRPPEYYGNSRWRGTLGLDGGGALMNQGVHTVDLLVWLFGNVARVQARMRTALHAIEVEDTAVAILEFASGPLGTLQATTAAYPGYPRRLEIMGSEGTVIIENDRIVAADLRTPQIDILRSVARTDEGAASPVVNDVSGHQAVFEDFIRAIEHDSTPACDGHDGRRSLELIEAIYAAARTSEEITNLRAG
ncbi:MAG: Gfo/Idh/MocA family oxidoreductase [Terriglobales bacterium]